MSTLRWIIRIGLGVLIAGAGLGKLLDLPGFVAVISAYQFHLSFWFTRIVAIGVTFFELILGVWILSGFRLRTAARWSMAMHAGYFFLLTSTLLRGLPLQNCGCFGIFLARPLLWYSPLEDVVLVGVSYGLFVLADSRKRK